MTTNLPEIKAFCFYCQREDYKIDMIETKDNLYFCSDCIDELIMESDRD